MALKIFLEDVFKKSGIPTYTFVRPIEYNKILVSLRTRGRGIIIEGPSGIGKTTSVQKVLEESKIPFVINRLGSMISVHFSKKPVTDFASAAAADNAFFNKFFHAMLNRGVYLPPSAYESWFLSNALTTQDLDKTIGAARQSLAELS